MGSRSFSAEVPTVRRLDSYDLIGAAQCACWLVAAIFLFRWQKDWPPRLVIWGGFAFCVFGFIRKIHKCGWNAIVMEWFLRSPYHKVAVFIPFLMVAMTLQGIYFTGLLQRAGISPAQMICVLGYCLLVYGTGLVWTLTAAVKHYRKANGL